MNLYKDNDNTVEMLEDNGTHVIKLSYNLPGARANQELFWEFKSYKEAISFFIKELLTELMNEN